MVDDFPKGLFRFYKRVYEVVDDPSLDSIISWSKSNKSFIIWNHQELRRRMIFANFHGPFFSNFFSMLKEFGFKRIKNGSGQLEFGNANFVRGQPELLKKMQLKANHKRSMKIIAKEKAEEAADGLKLLRV